MPIKGRQYISGEEFKGELDNTIVSFLLLYCFIRVLNQLLSSTLSHKENYNYRPTEISIEACKM